MELRVTAPVVNRTSARKTSAPPPMPIQSVNSSGAPTRSPSTAANTPPTIDVMRPIMPPDVVSPYSTVPVPLLGSVP